MNFSVMAFYRGDSALSQIVKIAGKKPSAENKNEPKTAPFSRPTKDIIHFEAEGCFPLNLLGAQAIAFRPLCENNSNSEGARTRE